MIITALMVLAFGLGYLVGRNINKLLKISAKSPTITGSAPQSIPQIYKKKSGMRTPKAHTDLQEYEFEKRLEEENRG